MFYKNSIFKINNKKKMSGIFLMNKYFIHKNDKIYNIMYNVYNTACI